MTTSTKPIYSQTTPPQLDDLPYRDYDPEIAGQMLNFIRPYNKKIFVSMIYMAISSLSAVTVPYLVKVAMDSGIAQNSLPVLRNTVLIFLFFQLLQWFFNYIRVNIMAEVGQSIIFDMRARIFEHLQELSLSFFSRYSVGRVISRVINDVSVLRDFVTWTLLAVARDIFTLVGILVTMMVMDWKLSLLTFTVLPIMAVLTFAFRKRARENYRRSRMAISWVNSVLAENINAVRVVQSFSREDTNYDYFSGVVNQYNVNANLAAARLASMFFPSVDFLGVIAMALVIWIGGASLLGETLTPGVLVAFVLYISRFFDPIRDLSLRYDGFMSTMASGERILSLINAPVEVIDKPGAGEIAPIQGDVNFENVSFHYMDDPQLVLQDVDLHIPAGETVALVGKTGAGKTTIIKLLSRFHDPTDGCVLVDGTDIRDVTQASLRRQMGIVLQDPFLFSGTVRENIRFGRLDASEKEVEEAAKAVGADEFIRKLRLGYETPVQEGGIILSVGQRQLISFARALLANPRILILDEATSSIDTQTEQIIQEALARLLKGRTAFVIAHRLSTIINADRIVVVDDGRVIEQGKHQELLENQGMYHKLYSMRFEEEV
ncbi:MAG: ABC transporter ATP-binding protein [Anaerolineaceae bacterium]|nr:ABC transporter ATP-binding protein [Anaerolineaceae bacterium]